VATDRVDSAAEDLSHLIRRIMAERDLSQTEVARRSGLSNATISAWVRGTRGGRRPRPEYLEKLADGLGVPRDTVFDAASLAVPGPLSPDAEERILQLYRRLTAEQQQFVETTAKALAEGNTPAP
jgi:transcriptional regulator with XRE-family HTH domain